MAGNGTSRHFGALRNLVAIGRRGPQQDGNVSVRNRKLSEIDRSGERPTSEPLPKPISHRNSAEPQRRTDELVALRRVEPRPTLHCGRDQIDAPHSRSLLKGGSGKRNTKNEKRKYADGSPLRGPRSFLCAQRDPKFSGGCPEAEAQ
jgi:hypothetical protein